MPKRPINDLLEISLENVSLLIDTSKVIGKPLVIDEYKAVIPIARVSFGFGAGGSEFDSKNEEKIKNNLLFESAEEPYPYGGGSLGGVSITPEAFLVIDHGKTEIVQMEKNKNLFTKFMDLFMEVMKKTK